MFYIPFSNTIPHPTSFNTARQAKSFVLKLEQSMQKHGLLNTILKTGWCTGQGFKKRVVPFFELSGTTGAILQSNYKRSQIKNCLEIGYIESFQQVSDLHSVTYLMYLQEKSHKSIMSKPGLDTIKFFHFPLQSRSFEKINFPIR